MPTVLRKDGFNFVIYPDDHEPEEPAPQLTNRRRASELLDREVEGNSWRRLKRENGLIPKRKRMSEKNVRRALKITYEYQDYLIEAWKEIHGSD